MSDTKQAKQQTLCIVCHENPAFKRGLCETHYAKFRYRKDRMPEDRRKEFDDYMVAKGLILPDARSGDDPFAIAAQEFLDSDDDTHPRIVIHEERKGKPKPPFTEEEKKNAIKRAFKEKPDRKKPTKKPPKKPKPEDVEKDDEK